MKTRNGGTHRWWWWVLVPLIVLGAVGAAGVIYMQYLGLQPVRQGLGLLRNQPFGGRKQVSILVLGVDSDKDPRRSDTIMVARVDLTQQRLGVVSIPRDFHVAIPGHGTQKINGAYSLGGVDLARRTVESLIGIPCDYFITINSPGLAQLVDALGGVEVNVDKRMYYRDRRGGLYIDLQPGEQRLNGEQAVGYVRYRHDRMGDLKRIERQQAFLRAVLGEALQPRNIPRLPKLLKLFTETVQTDLMADDLQGIARLVEEMGPDAAKAATLSGTPVDIRGISCLEPDYQQVARAVNQVLLGVPPRVAIVNATEIPGVESGLVHRLTSGGYEVVEARFASHAAATTEIVDRAQYPEEAAEIRRWLKCGVVVKANGEEVPGADITVLLGTDYLGTEQNEEAVTR
ncbi:MAG: LCP family protein [Armatimonadota bacterium]|nr:MAG: LCP family protein [Armatimonadota bacterium]